VFKVADLFNHQPEGPQTWAAMDDELDNPWQILRGDDGLLYVEISAHRLPFLRALVAPCRTRHAPSICTLRGAWIGMEREREGGQGLREGEREGGREGRREGRREKARSGSFVACCSLAL
jgi:hypothetical protein